MDAHRRTRLRMGPFNAPQIRRAAIEAMGRTTTLGELRMVVRTDSVIGPLLGAAVSHRCCFVTRLMMGGISLLPALLLVRRRGVRA